MNRNDKNRKYTALNINNVFKGKSVEPQNKTSYRLSSMQNIGKVSSMRRVPPPKWVPSLKAEGGVDKSQIINSNPGSWTTGQPSDSTESDPSTAAKASADKSQWNNKALNKPFFLIGQEFPSLHSEGSQESSQDFNAKDNTKLKDGDKPKSDDCRNRDANISLSTLNRIDALSISKTSKGDIAATGWAAEDDEPNFDEKLIFSDDESLNEVQNWHSDPEEVGKMSEQTKSRDKSETQTSMDNPWSEPNVNIMFPYQVPLNLQPQFLNQYPSNMISRNSTSPGTNLCEDPNIYANTVAEQRNARNLEYLVAIERARQKKLGTQPNRGFVCSMNEEQIQHERLSNRSRLTSAASDTTESMNMEMGPPGGPPLLHHHLPKPHVQPQIPQMLTANPILLQSQMAPSPSLLRYPQHNTIMMPIPTTVPVEQIHDPKLLEKWMEFLKQQTNSETNYDNMGPPDSSIHFPKSEPKGFSTEPLLNAECHTQTQVEKESKPVEKQPEPHFSENNPEAQTKETKKSKTSVWNEEDPSKSEKKSTKSKYYKDYKPSKPGFKENYGNQDGGDYKYYECEEDNAAYNDYNLYKQHYSHERGRKNYRGEFDRYYTNDYPPQSDYYYKSNSLKSKSKSKETNKPSTSYVDTFPSEERRPVNESSKNETDTVDMTDQRRPNKETKKSSGQKGGYGSGKRYEGRGFKDKPVESQQEYSMGFAVNPKERSYYTGGGGKGQKYYQQQGNYYNYPVRGGQSSKYADYDSSYYYCDYGYGYDKDGYPIAGPTSQQQQYPSKTSAAGAGTSNPGGGSGSSKRTGNRGGNDNWRSKDHHDRNTKSKYETSLSQNKPNNRNSRKTDKKLSSTLKDGANDNEAEEWETASEGGGSVQSNSVTRDSQRGKPSSVNPREKPSNNTENRKQTNKNNSNCNNGFDRVTKSDDNDDSHGGSADTSKPSNQSSAGSGTGTSRTADQKDKGSSSGNSNSNKTTSPHNESSSKSCSTEANNNASITASRNKIRFTDFIDMTNGTVNFDKLPEVTEDEDLLYDNTEQFQEVISKATKKNRKMEEMKRLKEQSDQNSRELSYQKKSKWETNSRPKRKEVKKEMPVKVEKKEFMKTEFRPPVVEKESPSSFKAWESSNGSMYIGSWDNKLADDIEKKSPPKPIGTPAGTSWNQKAKAAVVPEEVVSQKPVKLQNSESAPKSTYTIQAKKSEVEFGQNLNFSINKNLFVSDKEKTEKAAETQPADRNLRDGIDFDYDVKNRARDTKSCAAIKGSSQTLDDKINSVKTIWDNQKELSSSSSVTTGSAVAAATVVSASSGSESTVSSGPVTVATSGPPDTRSCIISHDALATPAVISIPNVCKVKPQLQQDMGTKKDMTETLAALSSTSVLPFSSSVSSQQQHHAGFYQPFHQHRLASDYSLDHHQIHHAPTAAAEAFASLLPGTQPGGQLQPSVNMNMNSAAASSAAMQQILLSRQNSLSGMLQPSTIHLPFIQSGQQPVQGQTPLYSQGPLLGGPQFPQGHLAAHYPTGPGSFGPPLHHHTPHHGQPSPFHPAVLGSHQQQHQQQQHPHDHRVLNSAAAAMLNSIISSADGPNSGSPGDFVAQQSHHHHQQHQLQSHQQQQHKSLSHQQHHQHSQHQQQHANSGIVTGLNGSAFMLQHNLNILMKPQLFSGAPSTNPQYNAYTTTMQSSQPSFKSGFETGMSGMKGAGSSGARDMDVFGIEAQPFGPGGGELGGYICEGSLAAAPSTGGGSGGLDHDFAADMISVEQAAFSGGAKHELQQYYATMMPGLDKSLRFSPSATDTGHLRFSSGGRAVPLRNYSSNMVASPGFSNRDHQQQHGYGAKSSVVYPTVSQQQQQHKTSAATAVNRNSNSSANSTASVKTYDSGNNHYTTSSKHQMSYMAGMDSPGDTTKISFGSGTMQSSQMDRTEPSIASSESKTDNGGCGGKSVSQRSEVGAEDKHQAWSSMLDDEDQQQQQRRTAEEMREVQQRSRRPPNSRGRHDDDKEAGAGSKFGYEETRLSSMAAQSLARFDPAQLQRVIMRLREGPVVTDLPEFAVPATGKLLMSSDSPSPKSGPGPAASQSDHHQQQQQPLTLGFYSSSSAGQGHHYHGGQHRNRATPTSQVEMTRSQFGSSLPRGPGRSPAKSRLSDDSCRKSLDNKDNISAQEHHPATKTLCDSTTSNSLVIENVL